jgi:uncharacterized RDD family membrane protein YckC
MCGVSTPQWNPPQPQPQPQPRPLPSPAVSPSGAPLADFLERLAAFVIDRVIITAIALVLITPVVIASLPWLSRAIEDLERANAGDDSTAGRAIGEFILFACGLNALIFGVALAVAYVYEVEAMFRSGQTVGKRIMKIRVVPLDPTSALTRGMAARRYLVGNVATVLVPFFSYVDGLWQLWDRPYRQCLHDKFAQTTVVKLWPVR